MKNEKGCSHHNHLTRACVSLVPIFNHLETEQMDEVMRKIERQTFTKGEFIYRAGEKSDSLYIVHTGQVKLYRLSESGKEQMLRVLRPGDFTGELALFQTSSQAAYAEALVDTEVCFMSRNTLQSLLAEYPEISWKILQELSQRLNLSEKQTTDVATEKVETRIAYYLVESMGDTDIFELPMSKKDVASYLGTTPETISRKLAEFETAGWIKQIGQRKIKMIDLDEMLLHV